LFTYVFVINLSTTHVSVNDIIPTVHQFELSFEGRNVLLTNYLTPENSPGFVSTIY